jgi:hypothetical protein
LLEHGGRSIDADHRLASCLCYRNSDPTVTNGKLDQGSIRLARKLNVEGNILGHMSGPLIVLLRESLVPTYRPTACLVIHRLKPPWPPNSPKSAARDEA